MYLIVNEQKWEMYRKGYIDKAALRASRFRETFKHFDVIADDIAWTLEERYVLETPYGTQLIEGTEETLTELGNRGYKMHIITNGFTESQTIKFAESGLKHHFDVLLCSDEVGVNKPDPKIFRAALSRASADCIHHRLINFVGMVAMQHHHHRQSGRSNGLAQQVSDPLWNHNG